jgi:hypothetical protein
MTRYETKQNESNGKEHTNCALQKMKSSKTVYDLCLL